MKTERRTELEQAVLRIMKEQGIMVEDISFVGATDMELQKIVDVNRQFKRDLYVAKFFTK